MIFAKQRVKLDITIRQVLDKDVGSYAGSAALGAAVGIGLGSLMVSVNLIGKAAGEYVANKLFD